MHASPVIPVRQQLPPSLLRAMEPLVRRFETEIREEVAQDRLVLPSVPATLLAAREALQQPHADIEEICRALSRDPALATRLLRIANSPAFAGHHPCNSLQAAVVRLGTTVADNVMLMLMVARVFNVGKRARIQPYLARLWKHSTRVAALSHALADCAAHLDRNVALLAGLIHDVGAVPVIVRAQHLPNVFDNQCLLGHLVGTLHCELGALVCKRWNVPGELVEVVHEHEKIDRDPGGPADYTDLVLVANLLSNIESPDPATTAPIWDLPASRKLGIDQLTLPDLASRAAEFETQLCASIGGH